MIEMERCHFGIFSKSGLLSKSSKLVEEFSMRRFLHSQLHSCPTSRTPLQNRKLAGRNPTIRQISVAARVEPSEIYFNFMIYCNLYQLTFLF